MARFRSPARLVLVCWSSWAGPGFSCGCFEARLQCWSPCSVVRLAAQRVKARDLTLAFGFVLQLQALLVSFVREVPTLAGKRE